MRPPPPPPAPVSRRRITSVPTKAITSSLPATRRRTSSSTKPSSSAPLHAAPVSRARGKRKRAASPPAPASTPRSSPAISSTTQTSDAAPFEPFTCALDGCTEQMTSERGWKNHLEKKHKAAYGSAWVAGARCSYGCDRTYGSWAPWVRHHRIDHRGRDRTPCPLCVKERRESGFCVGRHASGRPQESRAPLPQPVVRGCGSACREDHGGSQGEGERCAGCYH